MPGQRYHTPYMYSAGHLPAQLPAYPYAQYPQVPWGYQHYPQYAGGPAGANPYAGWAYPVSPRQRKDKRRSLTPPPDIELHHLLGGRYRPTVVWDVTQDVPAARHINKHGALEKISESVLLDPATNPPIRSMRIVSDAFPWDININLRDEVVTVDHILGAIHGTLQKPLEKEDWDEETKNAKRNMHKARCMRLARGAPSFKLDMHLKQIDVLGDKTFFMGLKPVGPPDAPEQWLLKLGPFPKERRR